MNEQFAQYLKDLPPELQEKAKDIETMEELNEFLAENDVELPEDALEAVSGGCLLANEYDKGTVFSGQCPDCGGDLLYIGSKGDIYPPVASARCPKSNKVYYKDTEISPWRN